MNHITILISTRNSAKYVKKCLDSAISQDYENFDIIFIDADSSDNTFELAKEFERPENNLLVIKNDIRKYQSENILLGVTMAKPESIIITLDGDDWFPHNEVLRKVNEIYTTTNCWMTYGTYVEHPHRSVSHIYKEYPLDVRINKRFREVGWLASHLRTFRRELFLKINIEDLKDPSTGDFLSMVADLAFQFPMLEMCGVDKSVYIPDILYVYNCENPLSESKINQGEINRIEKIIRARTKYNTIEKLY